MSTFESIKTGLNEAIQHASGKQTAKLHHFDDINVKALREKMDMSQSQFAEKFHLNLRTLQNWEQCRKRPSGSSLVLLKVIEKNPEAVIGALRV